MSENKSHRGKNLLQKSQEEISVSSAESSFLRLHGDKQLTPITALIKGALPLQSDKDVYNIRQLLTIF